MGFLPIFFAFLKEVGDSQIVERHDPMGSDRTSGIGNAWYTASPQERPRSEYTGPDGGAYPQRNTLNRATAALPRLLYERMDERELGLNFTVLYSSAGLTIVHRDA